jgi:GNAT superfamily N-acetyltransferase
MDIRPYTIREAVRADLTVVAIMAADMIRQHHRADPERFFVIPDQEQEYEEYLTGELRDINAVVFIAIDETGAIVGYQYARVEPRNWYELVDTHGRSHDTYVAEAHRGQGLGKRLIEAAENYMRARGMKLIVGTVREGNAASQKMLADRGWKPTMVEMTKRLNGTPGSFDPSKL